jgi:CheY-like chemotaxis protein
LRGVAVFRVAGCRVAHRAEDCETALASGFDDCLKKPAEPADLANAVLHARR